MAISVVQSIAHFSNPPATFSAGVTAGNTVFLVATGYTTTSGNPTISAVKLGGSTVTGTVAFFNNSTTGGVLSPLSSGNGAYISIWMLPNCPGGGTTVDYTLAGFDGVIGQAIYEVSGLGTAPSLDKSNSGGAATGTAVSSGASGNITTAPEIVFGGTMAFSGTPATNSGWTCLQPSSGVDMTAGYQLPVSSGSSFTWSQTSSGSPWAAFVATVQGTAAAPPPIYVLVSAPWRPAPPPRLLAAQVITAPLPAPPAVPAVMVQSAGMPWRAPWAPPPQVIASMVTPPAQGSAALSGLGTLTAGPALAGSANLSGSGTLSAATTTSTSATLSGSGTLSAATTTGTAAALSGSGTLTALWTLQDTLTLSGVGTLSVSQNAGSANLTGLGSLTAAPQLQSAASLTGAGTLSALWTLRETLALSGQGTLSAGGAVTFPSSASLSGLGTLSAFLVPPFTVGSLTAASAAPGGALTASAAPLASLSATTSP